MILLFSWVFRCKGALLALLGFCSLFCFGLCLNGWIVCSLLGASSVLCECCVRWPRVWLFVLLLWPEEWITVWCELFTYADKRSSKPIWWNQTGYGFSLWVMVVGYPRAYKEGLAAISYTICLFTFFSKSVELKWPFSNYLSGSSGYLVLNFSVNLLFLGLYHVLLRKRLCLLCIYLAC